MNNFNHNKNIQRGGSLLNNYFHQNIDFVCLLEFHLPLYNN